MGNVIEIAALAAGVIYVIVSQVKGQQLQGTRLVLLPTALILMGVIGLAGMSGVGAVAIGLIAASALIGVAIGLGQGAMTRLESRDGTLWARLPKRALWLWAALILSRVAIMVVAHGLGAGAATSLDSVIVVLGINRLAQAGVIAARAARKSQEAGSGTPFTPWQHSG
jgi:hypothetical protein